MSCVAVAVQAGLLLAVQGCPRREDCAGEELQGTGEGSAGCHPISYQMQNPDTDLHARAGCGYLLNTGYFLLNELHL